MPRYVFILSAIAWLILAFTNSSFANEEILPLILDANLSKKIYYEGEPIVLALSLTNIQPKELTIAEPLVREGFVKIYITSSDGKEPNDPKIVYGLAMPPSDYGMKIKERESFKNTYSLNEKYVYGLKSNTYELVAIYDTSDFSTSYSLIWHGKVSGPKIKFQVKEPPDKEKSSFVLLKSANKIIVDNENNKYKQARESLLKLLKDKPDSVYAPYASFLISESHFVKQEDKTQHFAEASKSFEEFLRKFPDCPYYSDYVRTIKLPFSLKQIGQKEKAKEILAKAPEGYYKRRMAQDLNK